uniref:Uncharacterized protein n=1 Tax=Anguilla anguilla TaxID=7936 RepID=A0A0E9S9Q0_ANGAN
MREVTATKTTGKLQHENVASEVTCFLSEMGDRPMRQLWFSFQFPFLSFPFFECHFFPKHAKCFPPAKQNCFKGLRSS